MNTPTTSDLLKYADLQMAAEAFLVNSDGSLKLNLIKALTEGNKHASKFTQTQATRFLEYWSVVAQQPNTPTGFSGTVFKCIKDDPTTGAKVGETVMSFRSTEFVDDAARDNEATNVLEISKTGFAWGQLRDMEAWYQQLKADGTLVPGQFSITGYSLGGHLASAFNEMHLRDVSQVVTFNGAGIGGHTDKKTLAELLQRFSQLADSSNGSRFTDASSPDAFHKIFKT